MLPVLIWYFASAHWSGLARNVCSTDGVLHQILVYSCPAPMLLPCEPLAAHTHVTGKPTRHYPKLPLLARLERRRSLVTEHDNWPAY